MASCGTPLALQRFKGDKRLEGCIAVPAFRYSRAFSSEVGTGSREENAKKKERSIFERSMSPRRRGWEPVRVKKMRSSKERSIFERSMSLAKAGMGTGSREENAKKKERSIFDGDQQRSDPGFRQCPVSGEPPNRPVPAAAIVGLRDVIAIANLRDLPEAAIAPFESK